MKTIGYIDKGDGQGLLRCFKLNDCNKHLDSLFMQKRINRVIEALKELRHMGNIEVYFINSNKRRFLFEHNF